MSAWHDNQLPGEELRLSQVSQLTRSRGGRAFKVGALIIWALLMLIVVRALVRVDDQGTRLGTKIASLSTQRGSVKFRPAESILWVDATMDQAFHDGDTIVTASGARAVIKIGEGQRIELDENSMVGLDMAALKAGGNDGVNLTLFKGNLVAMAKRPAEVKKDNLRSILSKIGWDEFGLQSPKAMPAEPQVTIKSDKKSIKLTEAAPVKLAVVKPKAKAKVEAAPVVKTPEAFLISLKETKPVPVVEPKPVEPPKPIGPTAAELAALAAKKAAEAEKAAAEAAAAAALKVQQDSAALAMQALEKDVAFLEKAQSMGPAANYAEPIPGRELLPVVTPKQVLTLYTGESLREGSCGADDVSVQVQPGAEAIKAWKSGNKPTSWVGFLDVASSTDPSSRFRVFATATRFGKQTIMIPAAEICRLPRSPNAVGVSLNLTPGVVFKVGGPDTVGTAATRMFVGSLADFPAMPITVYVAKVSKGAGSRKGWIPQGVAGAPAGGYAIRLKTAQDLPALFDLIKGNGSFVYANASVEGMKEKVHLASNGLILATVGAASYTKDDIRMIASRLDASVGFTGKTSALIALPKASFNRVNALETALEKQGTIKVMSRNQIVTLKREDAQQNADQIRVLARSASSALTMDAKVVVP